jgi:hypothetical protein
MQRLRQVERVLLDGMQQQRVVQLTGDEIDDVFVALDRIGEHGLTPALIELRQACASPA